MDMIRACRALAPACALFLSTAAFGIDSIADLAWCPGSRDCLQWTASTDADHYNVYRGATSQLGALANAQPDSCTLGSYTTNSTGAFADARPGAGEAQWYLIGAVDGSGAEATGEATGGPRVVDSAGPCTAAATLVVNEIDYDQPGADSGEFVEIFNPTGEAVDLTHVVLILVNGSTGAEYHRVALAEAAATLPAGGYLVAGGSGIQSGLPAGTPFVGLGSSIQNGAPDGVALFDTATATLLDALSYEGSITAATFDDVAGTFDLVEGSAATAADSNAEPGALARVPDGNDTGDASADWSFVAPPTPGSPNGTP